VPGYVSRYELVSFTTVPYSRIEARIRRQDRLVAGAGLVAGAAGVAGVLLGRRSSS